MPEIARKPEISVEREKGTLYSFFAIKFHEGDEDRAKVERNDFILIGYFEFYFKIAYLLFIELLKNSYEKSN